MKHQAVICCRVRIAPAKGNSVETRENPRATRLPADLPWKPEPSRNLPTIPPSLSWGNALELDTSNRIILGMLQNNGRERLEDIACEAGISAATVQWRVRALNAEGCIARVSAIL